MTALGFCLAIFPPLALLLLVKLAMGTLQFLILKFAAYLCYAFGVLDLCLVILKFRELSREKRGIAQCWHLNRSLALPISVHLGHRFPSSLASP
jgi:hypothetical protein